MTETSEGVVGLLGGYRPPAGVIDELVDYAGEQRSHWAEVAAAFDTLGPAELQRRQGDVRRLLEADGASYRIQRAERPEPWKLDAVPLVMPEGEWATIEAGVIQRATLLDLIIRDVYGERKLLQRGVIPPEVLFRHPGFVPACDGTRLPNGGQLFTYALDLGRDAAGTFVALADYAQAPSGSGYALENRVVLSRVFARLYRSAGVHRVAPFFRALRAGLEALGERRAEEPKIVMLSPGPLAETAFEHGYLASYLGCTLVEGSDLVVRDGSLFLRSLGTLEQVDVLLRRVDAAFSDPLELLPDSQLGVPGLLEASRRGTVALVNPLGSGVIENPALGAYLPAACEALLGQELRLATARSWWCGEEASRRYVLDHLDQLVLRPIGGHSALPDALGESAPDSSRDPAGPELLPVELGANQRDLLRLAIDTTPGAWVAQELLPLSTAPTLTAAGVRPRRAVLRSYAVATESSFEVMPGGLTRVAPDESSARISNQLGAVAKDTWVLAGEPERPSLLWLDTGSGPPASAEVAGALPERAADNLFWLGRYIERADVIVRLLRALDDRRFDQTLADDAGEQAVGVLLDALAAATFSPSLVPGDDVDAELALLTGDPSRPGSVPFALSRLLASAEAVRDRLSADTWQVTASLEQDLIALASVSPERTDSVQGTLGAVTRALLTLHGLVDTSMVRDAGWYFLDAGRRIERFLDLALILGRSLAAQRSVPVDSLVLESLLVTADSIMTHRRRYRSRAGVATVCELLVADAANPRSLRYQIDRLGEALTSLPPVPVGTDGVDARQLVGSMRELFASADAEALASVDHRGHRPSLASLLDTSTASIAGVAEAIAESSFGQQPPAHPLGQEGWS